MPFQSFTPALFNGAVEIAAFGRPFDWNMSNNDEAAERISHILGDFQVGSAGFPIPSFDTGIVSGLDFLTEKWADRVYRGERADGLLLDEPNTAYGLSSADCPTVVLYDPESGAVAALHAGRDALVDRQLLDEDERSRKYHSVVTHGVKNLKRDYGADPQNIRGFVAVGIAPENFSHPTTLNGFGGNEKLFEKYADSNRRMIDFFAEYGEGAVRDLDEGTLDLNQIIKYQMIEAGLRERHVDDDGIDTYGDREDDGTYTWWSNRHEDCGRQRNLVLVIKR
jgi:copper oxidase (laccase) domain-containing protein